MGNVPRHRKARKRFTSRAIAHVCGDGADDLDAVSLGRVDEGPIAYTVDCYTVDEIGVAPLLVGLIVPEKKHRSHGESAGKPSQPTSAPMASAEVVGSRGIGVSGRLSWPETNAITAESLCCS